MHQNIIDIIYRANTFLHRPGNLMRLCNRYLRIHLISSVIIYRFPIILDLTWCGLLAPALSRQLRISYYTHWTSFTPSISSTFESRKYQWDDLMIKRLDYQSVIESSIGNLNTKVKSTLIKLRRDDNIITHIYRIRRQHGTVYFLPVCTKNKAKIVTTIENIVT